MTAFSFWHHPTTHAPPAPIVDTQPTDIPFWLKITAAIAVAAGWMWAVIASLVRPFADDRWFRAYERCADRVEQHLREVAFASELDERESAARKIDALQDSVTALVEISRRHGEELRELPSLTSMLGRLDETLKTVAMAMRNLESRTEQIADAHHHLSGVIEALRSENGGGALRGDLRRPDPGGTGRRRKRE